MIKISDNIDEIKTTLEAQLGEFMNTKKKNQILEKIPQNLEINEKHAKELLRDEINSINYVQTTQITFQIINIGGEIAFKPPHKYDQVLYDAFKQWNKDPIDKDLVRRIVKESEFMRLEYNKFYEKFIGEMKTIDEIRENIRTDIVLANSLFDQLIQATDFSQIEKITIKSVSVLSRISSHQFMLLENLRNVNKTLKDYNGRRVVWEEILIGMRKSLTAARKQLRKVLLRQFSDQFKDDLKSISCTKIMCGNNTMNDMQ